MASKYLISKYSKPYRRFVRHITYDDWREYYHYLKWRLYCKIYGLSTHDLENYYIWNSSGSFHPQFIQKLTKDDEKYRPEWDMNCEKWKNYLKENPDKSSGRIKHYLWIIDMDRLLSKKEFREWKKTSSLREAKNKRDMSRWIQWINFTDYEIKNHAKYLRKKHPNANCIYCGDSGMCSCAGLEMEWRKRRRWEKLKAKLLG